MNNPGFNNIFVTSLDKSKDKVHISLEASSTPIWKYTLVITTLKKMLLN